MVNFPSLKTGDSNLNRNADTLIKESRIIPLYLNSLVSPSAKVTTS